MRTLVALCLLLAACAHGRHHSDTLAPADTAGWPRVRIDEPEGARFVMERGVFGEGLDVVAPFQGQFQPTGWSLEGGYPFEVTIDAAAAKRYGAEGAVTLTGALYVRERPARGVLRLAPNECSLRALLSGDLTSLTVYAEELPTADVACAGGTPSCGGGSCGGGSCGADKHAACPHGMHGGSSCGMHPGCGMHGMHGGSACGMHGEHGMHGRGRQLLTAPAILTLRVKH